MCLYPLTAKGNENKLHILIHDECHYEVTDTSPAAKLLFEGKGSHYTNLLDPEVQRRNLIIVNVSATPYVRLSKKSLIPLDNRVLWTVSDEEKLKNGEPFFLNDFRGRRIAYDSKLYVCDVTDSQESTETHVFKLQGKVPVLYDSQNAN